MPGQGLPSFLPRHCDRLSEAGGMLESEPLLPVGPETLVPFLSGCCGHGTPGLVNGHSPGEPSIARGPVCFPGRATEGWVPVLQEPTVMALGENVHPWRTQQPYGAETLKRHPRPPQSTP